MSGSIFRSCLAIAVVGLASLEGPAWASTPSGSWVVIGVGACDDPNLGANTVLVREALAGLIGPSVLNADAAQDRFGVFPRSSLDKAMRGLAAMQRHYVATEFAEAFDSALAAEAALQRVPPSPEEDAARIELALLTVESLVHGAEGTLAQAAIERLAELKPQVQLDPLRYPPSLQRMWAVAKTHIATQELEPLAVPGPPGARVYLDGLAVGEAPLELRVRSGESFDLQLEKGGLVSRHYSISPTSSAFPVALNLSDEARFQAVPDLCFDAGSLAPELAQGMLLRSLDIGGAGRFGTRPDLVDNVVLVSLESAGNELLSAALWSRSAAGIVRQARIATIQGATNPEVAGKLGQFVATGERMGSDPVLLP